MKLRTGLPRTSGLTLLELVVVVGILAMFVGLVSFRLSPEQLTFAGAGGNKTAGRIATESTMGHIKSAMFGSMDAPGYWADMNKDVWFWPRYLEWLSVAPTDVTDPYAISEPDVYAYYTSIMSYNPKRKIGWRGPYIQFKGETIPLDPSRGYTSRLGGGARKSPIDAWGNPIVMQWPTQSVWGPINDFVDARGNAPFEAYILSNSRLVSPGPDGILQTELNLTSLQTYADFLANPGLAGDDVVVWLQQ